MIKDLLKNVVGWKTKRKIVVFAVDDYGNVRVASKRAREEMNREGLKVNNRFDAYDTLETRDDLIVLFEALHSVKDKNGQPCIITPYTLTHNLDFDRIIRSGFDRYEIEALPATLDKLAAEDTRYEGVWDLWKEGVRKRFFVPQFHGREHLNVKIIKEKLAAKNHDIKVAISNRSMASLLDLPNRPVSWAHAFSYWDTQVDTVDFSDILTDGINAFEQIFGFKASGFTPPAQQFPDKFVETLPSLGIRFFDRPFYQVHHLGLGRYKKRFSFTRFHRDQRLTSIVRNVVFEPTHGTIDHVARALREIEIAFHLKRPAIISSHRVNFCGHIDEKNRLTGIESLRSLLRKITQRWPEAEFMAVDELGSLIEKSSTA